MKRRDSEPGCRLWEYPWYWLVTIVLLLTGVVSGVFGLVKKLTRPPNGHNGMIKRIVIVIVGIVILVAAYFMGAYFCPVDLGDKTVSVVIRPGDSFRKIGHELLKEGVVRSRPMLFYPARWRGLDKKLIPGRYDFTGRNSCHGVLDKLERGDFAIIKVTLWEGAPIWKAASLLAEKLEVDSAEVVALNSDSAFLNELGVPCLEGYLFPETYFFPWGTGLKKILSDMVAMYRAQTVNIWPDTIINGLSPEEIIVLASIVEAEALLDEEKPIIASVYQNRLRRRMRLDADPTVIYGLGGLDRPLNRRDLQKKTRYNTYRIKGLPPTPINSPGLAAIEATLHPANTDYLYFVADGSGRHRFSCTNAEHNRARYDIKRALKER